MFTPVWTALSFITNLWSFSFKNQSFDKCKPCDSDNSIHICRSSIFFFKVWILFFLYSRFLLVIHFVHISVYMSVPISQFIPPPLSPLGVHRFVLYICVSISFCRSSVFTRLSNYRVVITIHIFLYFPCVYSWGSVCFCPTFSVHCKPDQSGSSAVLCAMLASQEEIKLKGFIKGVVSNNKKLERK